MHGSCSLRNLIEVFSGSGLVDWRLIGHTEMESGERVKIGGNTL